MSLSRFSFECATLLSRFLEKISGRGRNRTHGLSVKKPPCWPYCSHGKTALSKISREANFENVARALCSNKRLSSDLPTKYKWWVANFRISTNVLDSRSFLVPPPLHCRPFGANMRMRKIHGLATTLSLSLSFYLSLFLSLSHTHTFKANITKKKKN